MVSRLEVLLLYRAFLRICRQVPDVQLSRKFAFNVREVFASHLTLDAQSALECYRRGRQHLVTLHTIFALPPRYLQAIFDRPPAGSASSHSAAHPLSHCY
jgi:hypothetical protein